MAALSITAVRPTPNTTLSQIVTYGATLATGVPVYLDSNDRKHKAGDNNASDATKAVVGITVTPGVDAGSGVLATRGNVILVGASMTLGARYYLGPTAGEIVPFADLGSGNGIVEIGTAVSATELKLGIANLGVEVA